MSSTAGATKLVIGASGFLGSHVTRRLVERGERVRVLVRTTSSTAAIDHLTVERHYGDVFDDEALRAAMVGVDDVYYCVVDTRAWLRDPLLCSGPMSKGYNTFWTSQSTQSCGGSSSPAVSAPLASPRPVGSRPRTTP